MAVMIEARSYRPFKSSEEYLYAMKEDLAEWLNLLYPELMINVDNFMDRLDSGVALCKHANNVRDSAIEHEAKRVARGLLAKTSPLPLVSYFPAARPATFFARDNVSNFITWSRNALKIFECLLFETDDLIMRKNEKHVILCLLEVARKGSKFGMLAPMLVQMEKQIDREIMADARRAGQGVLDSEEEEDDSSAHDAPPMVYGPMPQIVTNDLKSLDEMVRDLVERCNCPTQFPMIRVSEGKYRIGDTKVLIFVRILRSHVMVRVGGGWDTLSHYLDKHDPCRCKAQHRTTHAARVVQRYPPAAGCMDLNGAEVHYERSPPRTRRSSVSSVGSSGGGSPQHLPSQLGPPQNTAARQRSRSPANRGPTSLPHMGNAFENQAFNHLTADNAYYQSKLNRRSASPSPARKLTPHSRVPSPKPIHKKSITQNSTPHLATQPESFSNPSLVHSDSLVPNPHRNYRSRSPTPRIATNGTDNKVNSPDKDVIVNGVYDNHMYTEGVTTMDGVGNGSENASDNGSEVSDEGYRSLGLIQNTSGSTQASPPSASSMTKDSSDRGLGLKLNRFSIGSQASTEDADILERPDTLSGNETPYKSLDSGTRLYEERMRNEEIASMNSKIDRLRNPPHEEVSSITGLRKTNYSETLYGDKKTPASKVEKTHSRNASTPPICLDNNDSPSKSLQKSATSSKIPQSPVLTRRRLSVENLSPQNRSRSASYDRSAKRDKSLNRDTPSPTKRSSPAVKSPKDAASKPPTVPANSPTGGNVGSFGKTGGNKIASASGNNTWNGRTPIPKGKTRPGLSNETFVSPAQNRNHSSKISSPSFQRNTNLRASTTALRNMAGYDHNGRKIKTSPNSSPTKTAKQTRSPLLEKILKSAENVHDDLMVLEAVKDIIKQYTFNDKSDTIKNCCEDDVYSDFTSAWVHSNGALERSQSTKQLTETHSSPSQDTVSNDSNENGSGLKSTALVSKIPMFTPRKDSKAGITSRIPAPVSASAYKKSTDVCD